MFGPKKEEVTGVLKNDTMRSFRTYNSHLVLGLLNHGSSSGRGM